MTQEQQPEEKVSISIKLDGKEAEKFLRLKAAKFIKNNAEVARMLMMPALESELARLDRNVETQAAA